jgi:four helix bundle protein
LEITSGQWLVTSGKFKTGEFDMAVRSYRELVAWQKAMDLVTEVYRVTRSFPKEEQYGITSQLRRAAVSIPGNIAEGQGRQTTGEFRQFLGQARGSLLETETQILLSERLEYLEHQAADCLLERAPEVGRILNGLLTSLEGSHRSIGH